MASEVISVVSFVLEVMHFVSVVFCVCSVEAAAFCCAAKGAHVALRSLAARPGPCAQAKETAMNEAQQLSNEAADLHKSCPLALEWERCAPSPGAGWIWDDPDGMID